jgi:hypothetical protein
LALIPRCDELEYAAPALAFGAFICPQRVIQLLPLLSEARCQKQCGSDSNRAAKHGAYEYERQGLLEDSQCRGCCGSEQQRWQ